MAPSELSMHESSPPKPRRQGGVCGLRSRHRVHLPRDRAAQEPVLYCPLRRRGHRRRGSMRRWRGSEDEGVREGTTWRRGSFRSGSRPGVCTRREPLHAWGPCRGTDRLRGAQPSRGPRVRLCSDWVLWLRSWVRSSVFALVTCEKQLQILRLTTPELKKTFGAPFAQDDSHCQNHAGTAAHSLAH